MWAAFLLLPSGCAQDSVQNCILHGKFSTLNFLVVTISLLCWPVMLCALCLPQVVSCPPNVKGNTVSGGGSKPATLETGAILPVPLFIEEGSMIKIDTRTGVYLSKA